jgi:hypothetical protein
MRPPERGGGTGALRHNWRGGDRLLRPALCVDAITQVADLAWAADFGGEPAIVRVGIDVVTDAGIANDAPGGPRAGAETGATVIDITGEIDADTFATEGGHGAIRIDAGRAVLAFEEDVAIERATLVVVDAWCLRGPATTTSVGADLWSGADVATAAAVQIVPVRIDAAKATADDAGALEAGAPAAIARTTVVMAGAGSVDLHAIRALAGIEVECLAARAILNAA